MRGDAGFVQIDDMEPYARTLFYYYGEAKWDIASNFYAVGRLSAIGTFDGAKGYQFGGDYNGAAGPFNFDMKSLTRVGFALGYKINESTVLKAEIDNDTIQLIDAASGMENPGTDRYTLAAEAAVKF